MPKRTKLALKLSRLNLNLKTHENENYVKKLNN